MAHKVIDHAELLELVASGAIIKREDHPTSIERFDDLITALEGIAKSNELRASADLARSQAQLEIMATLQGMVRRQANATKVHSAPMDLEPLKEILLQMQAVNERPPVSYQFDILRSGDNGPMSRVIAAAIAPTQH